MTLPASTHRRRGREPGPRAPRPPRLRSKRPRGWQRCRLRRSREGGGPGTRSSASASYNSGRCAGWRHSMPWVNNCVAENPRVAKLQHPLALVTLNSALPSRRTPLAAGTTRVRNRPPSPPTVLLSGPSGRLGTRASVTQGGSGRLVTVRQPRPSRQATARHCAPASGRPNPAAERHDWPPRRSSGGPSTQPSSPLRCHISRLPSCRWMSWTDRSSRRRRGGSRARLVESSPDDSPADTGSPGRRPI